MKKSSSRYTSQAGRPRRPAGLWHDIPAGIRGGGISFALIWVLILASAVTGVATAVGLVPLVWVCGAAWVLFYLLNGMLGGWQAKRTQDRQTSTATARKKAPNYAGQGALAGLTLAVLLLGIVLLAQTAAYTIFPFLTTIEALGFSVTVWPYLLGNAAAQIALGALGGILYGRVA